MVSKVRQRQYSPLRKPRELGLISQNCMKEIWIPDDNTSARFYRIRARRHTNLTVRLIACALVPRIIQGTQRQSGQSLCLWPVCVWQDFQPSHSVSVVLRHECRHTVRYIVWGLQTKWPFPTEKTNSGIRSPTQFTSGSGPQGIDPAQVVLTGDLFRHPRDFEHFILWRRIGYPHWERGLVSQGTLGS